MAFTLVRELIFQVTTQRMINKIMSRGFYEYAQASGLAAKQKTSKRQEFKAEEDLPEDLGTLAEIGL
jgi:site-specific recombinase XerD